MGGERGKEEKGKGRYNNGNKKVKVENKFDNKCRDGKDGNGRD